MRSRHLHYCALWLAAALFAATSLVGCNAARMFSDSMGGAGGSASGGDGDDGGTSSTPMSGGGASLSTSGAPSSAAGSSAAGGATPTGTGGAGQAQGGADNGGADNGGAGNGGAGNGGADNGGAGLGGAANLGGAGAGGKEPGVEGIIGVGYGGLRVVSRDGGENWENETHWSVNGSDDEYLLRAVAYGNGRWMAGGARIATSDDGVTWEDRGASMVVIESTNCLIVDGIAFGNGQFLVMCGSNLASTTDGMDWDDVGETPDVDGLAQLVFNPASNLFGISGDGSASFVSEDGVDWEAVEIDRLRYCLDAFRPASECPAFWHAGVFLREEWDGYIQRSLDGEEWTNVYVDEFENNIFMSYSFGVGRVRSAP